MDESPSKENAPPLTRSTHANDTFDSLHKQTSTLKASPSSAMPSRNSPLSWQRRPNSQASDRPRSRPLSQFAAENAARSPRATPEPSSAPPDDRTFSRDQIAQSLASKDPAWFRQTSDRAGISAAYRRNQVEDSDIPEMSSSHARTQLPGMSQTFKDERNSTNPLPATDQISPEHNATRGSIDESAMPSTLGSPIPTNSAQRLNPPSEGTHAADEPQPGAGRNLAMSPSQGRISPERVDRSISPTKGMGGFVQSAMMKRTDSVNKRWSVQSPPNLSRNNSTANHRSSLYDPGVGGLISPPARDSRPFISRDNSPRPPSRPASSHGNASITQESERPGTPNSTTSGHLNESSIKPSVPNFQDTEVQEDGGTSSHSATPISPTKTGEIRRWSPTKSSWLESALNKPESPKPKSVQPPQQPSWMSEIQKAKQKGSVDLTRSPTVTRHEVNIGGLMRSPPPGGHSRPLSISGIPAGFGSGAFSRGRNESISSQEGISRVLIPSRTGTDSPTPVRAQPSMDSNPGTDIAKEATASPKPDIAQTQAPLAETRKPKPETPPKKDFRASLIARSPNAANTEPEFKNVFGQLKKTKIQNYVAPDELKNNILRGKAGLNITGGPKKTEREDEFKEAILKKKEDFKRAQLDGKGVTRPERSDSQDSNVPEAIARRRALSRAGTVTSPPQSPPKKEITTPLPEALLRSRTMRESPKANLFKEANVPGRLSGKEAFGGKLADRFNPALAGLLARGPPPASNDTSRTPFSSSVGTGNSGVSSAGTDGPAEPGPQLTHMTKARARGPRRKAPTSVKSVASEAKPKVDETPIVKPAPATEPAPALDAPQEIVPATASERTDVPSLSQNPKPESTKTFTPSQDTADIPVEEPASAPTSQKAEPASELKPADMPAPTQDTVGVPAKEPEPAPTPSVRAPPAETQAIKSPIKIVPVRSESPSSDAGSQPASPRKLDLKRRSLFLDSQTEKKAEPLPQLTSPRSPSKKHMDFAEMLAKRQSGSEVKTIPTTRPKPVTPLKSPLLTRAAGDETAEIKSSKSPGLAQVDKDSSIATERPKSNLTVNVPPNDNSSVASPVSVVSPRSVKGVAAMWARSATSETAPVQRVKSPIRLPTHEDERLARESAGLQIQSPKARSPKVSEAFEGPKIGIGLRSVETRGSSTVQEPVAKALPPPPVNIQPLSPTSSIASARSVTQFATMSASNKGLTSPALQTPDNSRLVTDYFGEQNATPADVDIDTTAILSSNQSLKPKVKTMDSLLFEISENGSKLPVAKHQERMLFEGNMYLCSHTFEDSRSKKVTEVYFWVGNEVAPAAFRNVESQMSREARAMGGKLITMMQGKESPEFLQALGGVVIIRRGLGSKYDSLAAHILCCRRHLGEIVFDEVDFSPMSFCSGFSYLVGTASGKTYLWKGKGSFVDEISCARLTGMEYGLTGEIEEVEDGNEPEAFLQVFGNITRLPSSADHWRLKPSYDKYRGRLFQIQPSRVEEITQFAQTDISPSGIYVLDAFFEIYIIVGANSQSQFSAFNTALHFAQEYGILAAGMEDRPFVPVSTVVLEGVPRDMKKVFRKWKDEHLTTIFRSPSTASMLTAGGGKGGLRRARSLRVMPLMAALEATRS
jgi:hypothetical protein